MELARVHELTTKVCDLSTWTRVSTKCAHSRAELVTTSSPENFPPARISPRRSTSENECREQHLTAAVHMCHLKDTGIARHRTDIFTLLPNQGTELGVCMGGYEMEAKFI